MFKKKKILVVGDIMLDKYSHGSVSRVSPESPVPIVDIKKIIYKPGGASNVAQKNFPLIPHLHYRQHQELKLHQNLN